MILGNFLTHDPEGQTPVTVSGIEVGQWFAFQPSHNEQWLVQKASRVGAFAGKAQLVYAPMYENWSFNPIPAGRCHLLDKDYTEEQLQVLQARAFKEWATHRRNPVQRMEDTNV